MMSALWVNAKTGSAKIEVPNTGSPYASEFGKG